MTGGGFTFDRRGLGYVAVWEKEGVELAFSRVKRARDGLQARLRIAAFMPGIAQRTDGFLHEGRIDLLGQRSRSDLARYLGQRTNGAAIDWPELLERTFHAVTEAHDAGAAFEEVDVTEGALEELPYLLHGFARRGVVTWLYSAGGIGKTTLLQALTLSIASGREIVPGIAPAAKGRVMYLDWETNRQDFAYRLGAIARGHGIEKAPVIYRRCDRPLADEVEVVGTAIAEREVIALVVDSAGLALGGGSEFMDEGERVKEFFRAARFLGVTMIVADHVAKAKKGKDDATPIGSVYKENLARAAWELRKLSENEGLLRLSLHLRKANDRAKTAPIPYRLTWSPGVAVFAPEVLGPAEADSSLGARIAKLLEDSDGMSLELMAGMLDTSQASVKTVLYRLKRKGVVDRLEGGRWRLVSVSAGLDEEDGDRAVTGGRVLLGASRSSKEAE